MVFQAVAIGVGATAVMDLLGATLKRLFGVPPLDYGMVGRWIGHFPRGRFVHPSIAQASPIRGERIIGWTAHYVIGIVLAALLVAIGGPDWTRDPTPLLALAVGILAVVAPFFVMQPGMGAGIAASKTPNPALARLRSLVTHTVFGFGLYAAGLLSALLIGS
jgi:Protein of unknown function (DUF2938)